MMARFARQFSFVPALILAGLLTACGGGGGDPPPPSGGTTTISGAVTLSNLAGSPGFFEKIARFFTRAPLTSATVELYNADHPEWLYPVSTVLSDGSGNYTLNTLANSANNGGLYTNGDSIPSGKYTVVAYKFDSGNGKLYVAVQAFVKNFDGAVTGNDLVAIDSGVVPKVVTMFGLPANGDGTFGGAGHTIPQNGAVQVTFNTPMARLTVQSAISIKQGVTPIAGTWKVSPDLLSATFYPTTALTPSSLYTVTILGGNATGAAKNLYGQPIPSTVTGLFTADVTDTTPPNAVRCGAASGVSITAPIRIKSNELLDLNTFSIASTPSIGDKPAVVFAGKDVSCTDVDYPFAYDIIPATALTLDTDYTLQVSGAKDLAGLSLATLNANFKTEASHTAVIVTSSDPANGAVNVALDKAITVELSGLIKADTVTPSTLSISPAVAGTITVTNSTIVFTPAASLMDPGITYTVTAGTGIQDRSGAAITEASWSFTTRAPVTVSTKDPDNGATNVPVNQTITATFSSDINPATVTSSTFTISPAVPGNVTANSTSATFDPTPGVLVRGVTYTMTLTTGVKDPSGKSIAETTWSFQTEPPVSVSSSIPASGATNVAISTPITINFSGAVNTATITTSNVTLVNNSAGGASVTLTPGTITSTSATFTPTSPLVNSNSYTVNVTSGITDTYGVAITSDTWSFTTVALPPASSARWDTSTWDTNVGTGEEDWAP
jgi:methionine-rich copper-binding protein CopC